MRKVWLIGWKDVLLAARDPAALVFMLAAPFLLTLGMGLISGRLSGSSSGPSGIPVIVVNQDAGPIGQALVDMLASEDLSELLAVTESDDPQAARDTLDEDQVTAVVIVPAGFSESIIPQTGSATALKTRQLELVTNPTRPTSAAIVRTVVDAFMSRVDIGSVSAQVIVEQLIESGLVDVSEAPAVGRDIGMRQAQADAPASINLRSESGTGSAVAFDILAYMAPGMAMMFLMYVVSQGGRSFLEERTQGTLPRLFISPTTAVQVLGGKVLGVFLTGMAQMLILIGASAALFQLRWGHPLAVIVLVLASVTGAVGWGLLITALAKTPGQVSSIGSATMLLFGIMGGSFFEVSVMPPWFLVLRKITPNAWSIDGFTILARGGSLADITGLITALLLMGAVLFAVAAVIFNRRGIGQG